MQLTIVPSDRVVYIDRVPYGDIDMTWVPDIDEKKIHAVQWLDDSGEIEFVGPHQNLQITKLGVFENAVSLWKEKKKGSDEIIKEREERLRKDQEMQEMRLKEILNEIEEQFIKDQIQHNAHVVNFEDDNDNDNDDDTDKEEDLFYDIEELLKEI